MAVRMPRKVRVGNAVYTLTRCRLPADLYGDCNHAKRRVRIARDLAPQVEARTIVHELVHVAVDESGIAADPKIEAHEERIVSALEAPLTSLIADNPQLMEFIARAFKK